MILRHLASALLGVAALLWLGDARAAVTFGSQGEAYAACLSDSRQAVTDAQNAMPAWQFRPGNCPHRAGDGTSGGMPYYFCEAVNTYNGNTYACRKGTETRYVYPKDSTCDKKPSYTGALPWASYVGTVRNGSIGCKDGCDGVWTGSGDGQTGTWTPTGGLCPADPKSNCEQMGAPYYWNEILGVCSPLDVECPDGQVKDSGGSCKEACPNGMVLMSDGTCKIKENECPPGNVKAPSGECLPGEGQCAAGEVKGKDGTCKRDSDGDGKPDDGEDEGTTDETFAGGDSCNAPPACSGSPILCGQARIQWRIDCNTRRNRNISGGACSSPPVCTGEKCDAMEYSSLLMQWRSACALEKLAGKGDGEGDGGQPEWTKVTGMSQDPGAGEGPGDTPTVGEKEFSTSDLDQSGFGGGMCMGFPGGGGSGVVGQAYSAEFGAPNPEWCLLISRLRASLIVCAAAVACFIIARGVA